ncbi:hypothetical protein OIV83_005497 [Microbotryomycetes sp. JL201]|nr:hypothetical protein OIV83_005497 [Microbotryomycetes sp. JL201]
MTGTVYMLEAISATEIKVLAPIGLTKRRVRLHVDMLSWKGGGWNPTDVDLAANNLFACMASLGKLFKTVTIHLEGEAAGNGSKPAKHTRRDAIKMIQAGCAGIIILDTTRAGATYQMMWRLAQLIEASQPVLKAAGVDIIVVANATEADNSVFHHVWLDRERCDDVRLVKTGDEHTLVVDGDDDAIMVLGQDSDYLFGLAPDTIVIKDVGPVVDGHVALKLYKVGDALKELDRMINTVSVN